VHQAQQFIGAFGHFPIPKHNIFGKLTVVCEGHKNLVDITAWALLLLNDRQFYKRKMV
jgi:hypothetical protein